MNANGTGSWLTEPLPEGDDEFPWRAGEIALGPAKRPAATAGDEIFTTNPQPTPAEAARRGRGRVFRGMDARLPAAGPTGRVQSLPTRRLQSLSRPWSLNTR
jgi:hypothetical protein